MQRTKLLGAGALICAAAVPSVALAHHGRHARGRVADAQRHVLLISVDGLHQSDLQKWIAANPSSTLARMTQRGTEYTKAQATFPSDSFPGTLALMAGGTSKSTGVYYDDSYDRTLYAPSDTSCSGPQGTEAIYAEPADANPDLLTGGVSAHQGASLDPQNLPREKTAGGCAPLYPNDFLRTNTIFSVIHAAGLRTAWADKHPAYQLLAGHGTRNAIDDLFTPEINSVATSGTSQNGGNDWTSSENRVITYDSNKVQAVIDQIQGKTSYCVDEPSKCSTAPVPAILGMNFQAVSVGQKLPDPNNPGLDANGRPTIGGYAPDGSFNQNLQQGMQFVDTSLGKMVQALRQEHLLRSTAIIITAKHGQSPIDPKKLVRANPDDFNQVVSDATGAQFPDATTGLGQQASTVTDDVGLIWLSTPFQNKTGALVDAFNTPANIQKFDINKVISGNELKQTFGDPATDPRVPDAIVQPNLGGLYSTSKKKVAEHGGGSPNDREVALLVVGPAAQGKQIDEPVTTTQVAPTILSYLGLDPQALDAVRAEHTQVLPGIGGGEHGRGRGDGDGQGRGDGHRHGNGEND